MQISEDDLTEFRRLWKEIYGETITKDEASEHARQLLGLIKVVDGP
ncbi:MAG: hypothetical protein JKX80_02675 [Candidatus Pacebacteria bacterium]|nr:hypothetical protein [Candidatus Paceibacterota bacterium]